MKTIQIDYNTTIFILILLIIILLLVDVISRLRYFFNGRLISEHTLNNLLQQANVINDRELTQNYLVNIGEVIRFGYRSRQKMGISLQDELKCCDDLLAAYNITNNNNVKITYAFEQDILETKVPPYSIALLIENAIKHGFNKSDSINIVLKIASGKSNIRICLSGYSLPDIMMIRKPKRYHGLFYLIRRIRYFNYYHGCSYLDGIYVIDNQLVLNLAKTI